MARTKAMSQTSRDSVGSRSMFPLAFRPPQWPAGYAFKSTYSAGLYGPKRNHIFAHLMAQVARLAVHLAQPIRGRWAEIGCGPGALLPSLMEYCELTVGVDYNVATNLDASALTRWMCGRSVVVRGDAYALPIKQGSLDGLVALETVEHLDENRVFTECLRVLRPGGILVFSIPVEVGMSLFIRQIARAALRRRNPHFSPMPYPLGDLVRMALKSGDIELHRSKRVPSPYHHLYFSYRACLEEARRRFHVEHIEWCPLPGPWAFSLIVRARAPRGSGHGGRAVNGPSPRICATPL